MTIEEAIKELRDASDNEVRYGDTDNHYNEVMKRVEAFDMAIKALEQTRWIPCTEGLPEPNRLVLCYITTGTTKTYFLAWWNDIQNDWEEGIGGCRLLENDLGYEVIAWMPLMPYKPESEDKE